MRHALAALALLIAAPAWGQGNRIPTISEIARLENVRVFNVRVTGGTQPTISGQIDNAEGRIIYIELRRPWAINGSQRLSMGLPACVPNCAPPQSSADRVTVRAGRFSFGPFRDAGGAVEPGRYEFTIWMLPTEDHLLLPRVGVFSAALAVTSTGSGFAAL